VNTIKNKMQYELEMLHVVVEMMINQYTHQK
jgi:hypothetical protein